MPRSRCPGQKTNEETYIGTAIKTRQMRLLEALVQDTNILTAFAAASLAAFAAERAACDLFGRSLTAKLVLPTPFKRIDLAGAAASGTGREVIAVDGSAENVIASNRFETRRLGRRSYGIWLDSRNGRSAYREADAGYSFGNSLDNRDFADTNTDTGNLFEPATLRAVRGDGSHNRVDP